MGIWGYVFPHAGKKLYGWFSCTRIFERPKKRENFPARLTIEDLDWSVFDPKTREGKKQAGEGREKESFGNTAF